MLHCTNKISTLQCPTMKYKLHTLKNGLRVVLVPQPSALSATVMVLTGTGSRHESARTNGISHFLEHMLFKGTKKRPTHASIANEFDGLGSESNAFTSKDHTAYFAKVSSEHAGKALDIIADVFLNSTIPTVELNKERGAIIEEINMYEDMPMRAIHEEFEALLFGKDTPLGRTIAGPKKNIRTLKRKDLLEYMAEHYTADNTVVCVAGKFSEPKILADIRKLFTKFNHKKQHLVLKGLSAGQSAPKVAIKHKDTDQTHLMLGVPAYELNHKNEIALMLLNTVLGTGMSSRLFTEVREKRGLAYYIGSLIEQFSDTGYIVARAGVTHKNLQKTIKIILQELKKIKTKKVGVKELRKAKNQLKGTLALSLDTSDAVANYFASSTVLRGKVTLPEDVAKKIDKVTAKDLQCVAKDIFKTEQLNLAVIGPHKNSAQLLKLLKL